MAEDSAASGGTANERVALTVDGVPVRVDPGTLVIEAAEKAGIVVPYYCYHPGIPGRPAQCRVCLVEVEGQAKLQPACVLTVQEGMVVHTATEQAKLARKSVIEFLLLNHPLDCPICDAAGQCMLQDYAFETGQLQSRLVDEKLVIGRDRIADDILYFGDRCIVCTRCVRFMREVAGDDSLIVAQRGDRAYIDTFPGRELDNPFRGNIVDVCPVGALVHEDFLFKARAWDMDATPGVCPGCTTGCNVTLDTKENRIVRLKPRYNGEVNSYWMCDYGRKRFVMGSPGVRAEVPLLREDGDAREVGWDEALDHLTERLTWDAGGAAVVSPNEANENLFFLRRLLDHLGIHAGAFQVPRGDEARLPGFPKLTLRSDRAANVEGAGLFGYGRVDALPDEPRGGVLVALGDPLDGAPGDSGAAADYFLYIGSYLSPAAERADMVLPATLFSEMDGSFTNFEGRVQRFHQALQPPAIARPAWMVLSLLLSRLGAGEPAPDIGSAFSLMARATPAMAGMTWPALGAKGIALERAAPGQGGTAEPPAEGPVGGPAPAPGAGPAPAPGAG